MRVRGRDREREGGREGERERVREREMAPCLLNWSLYLFRVITAIHLIELSSVTLETVMQWVSNP